MPGKFIVFEGSDGSGKTTILNEVKKFLDDLGIKYILTREPGGTKIGEAIREILLGKENGEMHPRTEALLFAAARAQSVEEKLIPALNEGLLVISDRYVMSSIAYQAYARGLDVDSIVSINNFATNLLKPDATFFLDVDPIKVLERKKGQVEADRMEREANDYHERVYRGYKELVAKDDGVIIIDASGSVQEVAAETIEKLRNILGV